MDVECVRFHLYLLSVMEANGRTDLLQGYLDSVPVEEKEDGGKTCLGRTVRIWEEIKKDEIEQE